MSIKLLTKTMTQLKEQNRKERFLIIQQGNQYQIFEELACAESYMCRVLENEPENSFRK